MTAGVVAIVDDNIAVLQSLKFLLELDGYEVIAYVSATSFLADRTARPACLIVDYNMPGMTGLQLVAELRRQGDRIPVLLMCGLLAPDIVARATELEIRRLLEKPVEPDDFLKIVAEVLQETRGLAQPA